MLFSTFTIFGWATINSNDLQGKNSTLPTGALTFTEVSSVISISNIGSLLGNFAVLPLIHYIGPKRTNHLFCIPIIVNIHTINRENISLNMKFFWVQSSILLGKCIVDFVGTEYLLFVRIQTLDRNRYWWTGGCSSNIFDRHQF